MGCNVCMFVCVLDVCMFVCLYVCVREHLFVWLYECLFHVCMFQAADRRCQYRFNKAVKNEEMRELVMEYKTAKGKDAIIPRQNIMNSLIEKLEQREDMQQYVYVHGSKCKYAKSLQE